ncbi:MAG: hypothetical protein ACKN84_05220 [Candidatus Fonsibacter sp.]|nr:hypothetical protein [Pelagibacterales bacterium]
MKYLFLFFFLISCSGIPVIGSKKDQNIKVEPSKTIKTTVQNEYDISYFLTQKGENCFISLEIKNISNEEKRVSLTIEALDFADKKFEAFVVERRAKRDEIINSESRFIGIDCKNLRKINFYK